MDFTMIPWPQVGIGSGWLFVGVCVWAIVRGHLIPRGTHDDVIHDRDEWRAESRIKDAQIDEKDGQLRHMAEVGKLTEAILTAVRKAQGSSS